MAQTPKKTEAEKPVAENPATTPQGVEQAQAKIAELEKQLLEKDSEINTAHERIDNADKLIYEQGKKIAEQEELITTQKELIQQQAASSESVGIPEAKEETEEDKAKFDEAIKAGLAWFICSVPDRFFRCELEFNKAGEVYTLTREQLAILQAEPKLKLKQVSERGE